MIGQTMSAARRAMLLCSILLLVPHANAIQTIIHNNYIKVFGGKTTRYLAEGESYPFVNIILIFFLSFTAYFLLKKTNLHPILSGFIIFSVGLVYYVIAIGMFVNDYWWFAKSIISILIPDALNNIFYDSLKKSLPGVGESYVMPIVAPITALVLTYTSNIIFQFLHEQKDKKFLRETLGTYIAPKVLDKMYE